MSEAGGAVGQQERTSERPRLGWGPALLVVGVALAIRLAVARELGATALFESPQLDSAEFLAWARRLAAGDWSLPRYPTHGLPYPLLLAALLEAFDGSLAAVRVAQSVLGALTCLATTFAALRIGHSRTSATVAGLLLAAYGPLVLVDLQIWEEGLLLLLLSIGLLALTATPEHGAVAAAAAGLALGAATAVRPTAIVVLALAAFGIAFGRPALPRRGRAVAAFCLAAALVVAPAVILASRASGHFLFVRGFGALNLWMGNDPGGGGVQNARLGGPWDRLEGAPARAGVDDVSRYERFYLARSVARAFDDPGGQARVLASKAVWLLQAEEPRDIHSYAFFRSQSRWLAALPGFGLVLALAAIGIADAARRRATPWAVVVFTAALALPALVAVVGLRYRLPSVLGWVLLAAPAPGILVAAWRERARRRAAALLALAAVVFAGSHLRRHEPSRRFGEEWALSGNALAQLGRHAEAEAAYRRSDAADPSSGMGLDGLARLRLREGRVAAADVLLREAVRRDPDSFAHRLRLAELLVATGRTEAALAELRETLVVNPANQPALQRIAELAEASGDPGTAQRTWERLAAIRRDDPIPWRQAARCAGAAGEPAGGIAAARRAVELAPGDLEAWRVLGVLGAALAEASLVDEALDGLRAAGSDLAAPSERMLTAARFLFAGDGDEADRRLRALLADEPGFGAARALLLRIASERDRLAEAEQFLRQLDSPP